MIYGTAWKSESTFQLTSQAIKAGFRAFDTAAQPVHYHEAGVGEALAKSGLNRSEYFIQTKFTPPSSQDLKKVDSIPYDLSAPIKEQVRTSITNSLQNLKTDYLDAVFLHSPLNNFEDMMALNEVLGEFHSVGTIREFGLSNIYSPELLAVLHDEFAFKPTIVQNRFCKLSGFDIKVRAMCGRLGMSYQSFWTLTGNETLVKGKLLQEIAHRMECTPEQAWFAFVRRHGIIPLSGTTSYVHMCEDLDVEHLVERLDTDDFEKLNEIIQSADDPKK